MPWKTLSSKEFAKRAGVDYDELLEKHRLIKTIVQARKQQSLTQSQLAKKVGVSQPRIAKIESRIGTHNISFESLFRILAALGYTYKIQTRKFGKNARLAA